MVGHRSRRPRPWPGDNVVTNIDTNLQQVADNALATQILALRQSFDPQCNNNIGLLPGGHRWRGRS